MINIRGFPSMRAEILAALRSGPWAIRPEYLQSLADVAKTAILGDELESLTGTMAARQAQDNKVGAVAVIGISGVITPKPSFFQMFFGGTAMESFMAELDQAANDPSVSSILLNVDSPGGMIDLVPEAAAKIREIRKAKPVIAIANTDAASAAYWLASQADELVVTPSGMVGSVGVYSLHVDYSAKLEADGVKPTFISAGPYKTEGNPYEPLSEEALAAMQNIIDQAYASFTGDIAAGRGATKPTVKNGYGQGRMLTATDAKAAGMVDRIDTYEGTLARMTKKAGGSRRAEEQSPQTTALKERARYEYHRFKGAQM